MKNLSKKLITLILAFSLIFGLVACGGDDKLTTGSTKATSGTSETSKEVETTSTTTSTAEPVTLKVYSWWDVTKYDHLIKMKESFEEKNSDIKLEFVTIGSGYADAMIIKLAGGEIPDVMMLAMDKLPKFVTSGLLLPLDDFASQDYMDSLFPVVKNALTVDGVLYAAARDVTPKVMYLNTQMFDDAGIPIPEDTWTLDDFVNVAKQLTKGSGTDAQWGYYLKNYSDGVFSWIAMFDGKMYSDDGQTSVFSTNENTKEAIRFIYDIFNTHKISPTATQAAQYGDKEEAPFIANKVAMLIGSLSTTASLDSAGTSYTVLPVPYVKGKSQTSAFVNTWVIPKTAKTPELSWRVVEFLSGKEGQQIALDMKFGLPASTLVDTSAFVAEKPYNKYYVQSLETAIPYPVHINGASFQKMFEKECESLFAGAVTPEEFCVRVDEQSKEILSQ